MDIQDLIVKGRNKLVNSWIGVDPSLILNRQIPDLQQSFDSHGLAGKIKSTLDHTLPFFVGTKMILVVKGEYSVF